MAMGRDYRKGEAHLGCTFTMEGVSPKQGVIRIHKHRGSRLYWYWEIYGFSMELVVTLAKPADSGYLATR